MKAPKNAFRRTQRRQLNADVRRLKKRVLLEGPSDESQEQRLAARRFQSAESQSFNWPTENLAISRPAELYQLSL
jgi:hypothetical protein